MRQFYEEYRGKEILQSLIREIGWTVRVLQHQIENKSFEKYLLNQTNFDKALPEPLKHQAKLAGIQFNKW